MAADGSARTLLCQLLSVLAIVSKGENGDSLKSAKLLKGMRISKDNIARISGI